MTELSPQAQAVLEAWCTEYDWWVTVPSSAKRALAAALRAAADQVVPHREIAPQQDLESTREAMVWGMTHQTQITRHDLLAIAAELEGSP